MWTWDEIDRTFSALDDFRRRLDGWFQNAEGVRGAWSGWARQTWPRTNFYDNGAELVLQAEVPGLSEKDIQLTVTQDALTLAGERKLDAPEGYAVHRQERGAWKFARSFTLPVKIDPGKTTAVVKDGVLTVTLAKAPEAQPRRIAVKAS
ncbi:MAG TPA: Hsp20/alpha crystallin family protein [Haliangiales bacterium]|nr:Hsp20/alpha crystallin family protein [Haliangiales bacterium]